MKKLIVISDTHGSIKAVESLLPLVAENDYIVHLGDGVGDLRVVARAYPEKAFFCSGNCDFLAPYPEEGVLEIERIRIFYCHGHKYGVKRGDLRALAEAAKTRDCTVALYGHTHAADISQIDGVTLINPGSLRTPIQKGGNYCYLVVEKDRAIPTLVGNKYYG